MCKNAILFVSAVKGKKLQNDYIKKATKGISKEEVAEMELIFVFAKQNDVDLHKVNGSLIKKTVFDLKASNYESRIIQKVKKYILENNRGILPKFLIVNHTNKNQRLGFTSIKTLKEVSAHKSEKVTQAMSA